MDYAEYLRSPWWQAVRVWAIRRAKGRCQGEGCDSRRSLEVHHLCYRYLGDERTCDVKVLCSACHQRAHGLAVEPRYSVEPRPAAEHVAPIAWRVLVDVERRYRAYLDREVA